MKVPLARFAYVTAFLIVAGYAFVTLRGPRGFHGLEEKQQQIQQMEKRNAALAREVERKREHIRRLGNNPAAQDLEIRDRLHFVGPQDKVFITGEPEKK
ncbi:MAG: septum formation initiator family protein [Acidobacteriia bacterium]|nr:septum formation initiator family protein [Terriglobia bacterium]